MNSLVLGSKISKEKKYLEIYGFQTELYSFILEFTKINSNLIHIKSNLLSRIFNERSQNGAHQVSFILVLLLTPPSICPSSTPSDVLVLSLASGRTLLLPFLEKCHKTRM